MTMVGKSPQPSYKPPYLIRILEGKTSTAITKLTVKKQNFTKDKKCLENWGVFVLEFLGS